MGQIRHGSATTTHAVRAAIQRSRASLAQLGRELGQGKHGDGRGLYLFVRGASRTWSFRYTDPGGGRRETSLGTCPDVPLAEARRRRDQVRGLSASGRDPQVAASEAGDRTVDAWVEKTFQAIEGDLKGNGMAGRWMSPVRTHILPKLGKLDVTALTSSQVRDALAPVWRTKPDAARKALDRLGIVMRHAAAAFPGEVDVAVVPNARILLGSRGHKVMNIPSMPWQDVPAFYATLGRTPVELALRLLILTAARSGPVRVAHVDQSEGDLWTVPGANMKHGQDFRVPLSAEAIAVVDAAKPLARDGFLFCARRGLPISDAAMAKYLDRLGLDYRPHGFRSSFRVWAEETGQDWSLAEVALAHSVGSKVHRAYQRSDLLDRRRDLMALWASVVTGSKAN